MPCFLQESSISSQDLSSMLAAINAISMFVLSSVEICGTLSVPASKFPFLQSRPDSLSRKRPGRRLRHFTECRAPAKIVG